MPSRGVGSARWRGRLCGGVTEAARDVVLLSLLLLFSRASLFTSFLSRSLIFCFGRKNLALRPPETGLPPRPPLKLTPALGRLGLGGAWREARMMAFASFRTAWLGRCAGGRPGQARFLPFGFPLLFGETAAPALQYNRPTQRTTPRIMLRVNSPSGCEVRSSESLLDSGNANENCFEIHAASKRNV